MRLAPCASTKFSVLRGTFCASVGSFPVGSFDTTILGSKIWRPEKVLVWSNNFLAPKKCDGATNYFSFFTTSGFLVERLCCVILMTKGIFPRVIVNVL